MKEKQYRIVYTKRKTLALVVERNATLTVRAPRYMRIGEIERFINLKRTWIQKKMQQQQEMHANFPRVEFVRGEKFLYLGIRQTLQFPLQLSSSKIKDYCLKWYQKQAKIIIEGRAALYAHKMNVEYKKLKITNAEHQLGSCTSRKTLNFSWRLVMAPLLIIDYVVVHELTHLTHMNHSKRFWEELENTLPQYQEAKAWLKTKGSLLHI